MPDISPSTPTSAPSAPSSSPSPSPASSQPSSVPTSAPLRSTTAELSDKLFHQEPATPSEPSATSQHEVQTPDQNWTDAYKDGIHGVPVQELLQAISEGRLPDALHDKLLLQLKDGDREWEGNIASLRNGAMMRENFSRSKNELTQERNAFQAERTQFIEDFRGMKQDPEQFLQSMQSMGMPVLEAAKLLATQLATKDYMNRQAGVQEGQHGPGDDWYEAIQARQELNSMKRQHQAQTQRQQQMQQEQQFQQRSTAVQTAAIEAFKAVGIDHVKHPQYWDRAAQHLQRIYDAKPEPRDGSERPLTRGDIREAVRITKEEADAFLRSQNSPQQMATPGAAALDTRAGKTVPDRAPKQNSRKTTEEIAREMRERQGVRIR